MLSKHISSPWAIDPDTFREIILIIDRVTSNPSYKERRTNTGKKVKEFSGGQIISIPVIGPISRRANMFEDISGGTSIENLEKDFLEAVNDDTIKAIILDFDSPGGEVNGTNNLAELIFEAREIKPVYAYVSNMAASGAFWLASACNKIYADNTASVGSIGVILSLVDSTKAQEEKGIKEIEFISSVSPYKRPDHKTDDGKAVIQDRVDKLGEIFVNTVARNRDTTPDKVISEYGKGFIKLSKEALQSGMIDGISTYNSFIDMVIKENIMSVKEETQVSEDTIEERIKLEVSSAISKEHERQEEILQLASKHSLAVSEVIFFITHQEQTKADLAERILNNNVERKAKVQDSITKVSNEMEDISASNFQDLKETFLDSEEVDAINKLNEGRE